MEKDDEAKPKRESSAVVIGYCRDSMKPKEGGFQLLTCFYSKRDCIKIESGSVSFSNWRKDCKIHEAAIVRM